jgi:hypothetical protein
MIATSAKTAIQQALAMLESGPDLPLDARAERLEAVAELLYEASLELSRAATGARCVTMRRGAEELLATLDRIL